MNTQLRKLAMEADAWCDQHYPDNEFYNVRWEEKFAELIIRECVEVVKWTPSQFPNDEYVKNIKEHFGVEE